MWNHYEEVDGITIALTNAAFPFWHRKQPFAEDFRRPQIALTRATIHKLAASQITKDEMVSWLYKAIKLSEQTQAIIDRQENRDEISYAHIPCKHKSGYVYFMWCAELRQMKIGCSGNPKKRIKEVARKVGKPLDLIAVIKTEAMYELEAEMHSVFRCRHHEGEWFSIEPKHLTVVERYLKSKRSKVS